MDKERQVLENVVVEVHKLLFTVFSINGFVNFSGYILGGLNNLYSIFSYHNIMNLGISRFRGGFIVLFRVFFIGLSVHEILCNQRYLATGGD